MVISPSLLPIALRRCPQRIGGAGPVERGMGSRQRFERDDSPPIADFAQQLAILAGVGADIDDQIDVKAVENGRQLGIG